MEALRDIAPEGTLEGMEELEETLLNAFDRCDGCGVQAYHVASKKKHSDLLFCRHHEGIHRKAMESRGWTFVDDEVAIKRIK